MTKHLMEEDTQISNKHMKSTPHNCPLGNCNFKAQYYLSEWLNLKKL